MNELGIECPRQNRLIAAACHLLGLFPLYGAVACGVVWATTARTRTSVVGFQARQAFTIQLLFLALMLIPLFGIFFAKGLLMLDAPMAKPTEEISRWFAALLFVCSWVLFAFGAIRTYQDPWFRYPMIGEILWPYDDNNTAEK